MTQELNKFFKTLSINLVVNLAGLNILMFILFILSFLTDLQPNIAIFSCAVWIMMDSMCCLMSLIRNGFNDKANRLRKYFTNLLSWVIVMVMTIIFAIVLKDELVMKIINQFYQ